jgi:lysophospholipase L1-like esterase
MASTSRTVYLFAGDSLTEGIYGENYVERIAKALYRGYGALEGEVVNASRGGDTVRALLERIDRPLQLYQPDWVILAVGGNDVWLPWLTARSFVWWLWFGYRGWRYGQKPTTDLDRFSAAYRALIDRVEQTGARVLVCSTTPVGENLSSAVNRRLARLNGVIKHVAAECQVPVADVWQAYVEELATLPKPSNYVPGEWLFTWMDRRRIRVATPDEVGKRRRLHLTFDGVHLNSRGADLWAHTVLASLAQARGNLTASPPVPVRQLGLSCFRQGPLQACCTPGWEVRAGDVARLLATAYQSLASLTGAHPTVWLAVLSRVHWEQATSTLPYPAPVARWEGSRGTVLVPDSYPVPFLRDRQLTQTVSAWQRWPPALAEVDAPAKASALADLLAVQEMARLFLSELQVAPTDPALTHLLAAYLTEVVLHSIKGAGAAEMAAVWDAWGQMLAASGAEEGQVRLQARALFETHGDGLVASFAGRPASLAEQVTVALTGIESG